MKVQYIGIVSLDILPPIVIKTMGFLMTKLFKCLCVVEDVYIGLLRPATLPLAIVEFIILVLMLKVELCLKRPAIFPLIIVEQQLMLTREVNIGLRPATVPRAYNQDVVYSRVFCILLVLQMKMSVNTIEFDIVVMDLRMVISVVIVVMGD